MAWQQDPNGNVTTHVYDALDRLGKVVVTDATDLDTAAYTEDATAPPADAQMNQYPPTADLRHHGSGRHERPRVR